MRIMQRMQTLQESEKGKKKESKECREFKLCRENRKCKIVGNSWNFKNAENPTTGKNANTALKPIRGK